MTTEASSGQTGGQTGAAKPEGTLHRLYTGTGLIDIIGRRKWFYVVFGGLVLICLLSIVLRGFNFSIEFVGGTQIQLPSVGTHGTISTDQAKKIFSNTLNTEPASVQSVGNGNSASIQIHSETLTNAQVSQVETALFQQLQPLNSSGHPSQTSISDSEVSAEWGSQISQQALIGLLVFLVLVSIFLAVYFEPRMALAALVSLFNDIIVTAGVYSIVGFEVTPATVIGLLTILGFSLYDTVVVFDKVRENTRGLLGLTRQTFGQAANLAVNQTLMRSINTSLIALLPVLGLLIVGVGVLGVGTLQDLALVQLVGMLIAAFSSICLATPLLVDLKMRQPAYRQQARKVLARQELVAKRAAAAASAGEPAPAEADLDETAARETAYAASVPARHTPKSARAGRPSGKSGRPSGKRRR
ncbi:MAG TPA: protein translocase subunit SecF [Pseudonocardiaceae bacterium]|jgi:preprotein translocase subunit SecF|nr:protein translocase subunit SecF [Pseudonocardiaceae bacterium]